MRAKQDLNRRYACLWTWQVVSTSAWVTYTTTCCCRGYIGSGLCRQSHIYSKTAFMFFKKQVDIPAHKCPPAHKKPAIVSFMRIPNICCHLSMSRISMSGVRTLIALPTDGSSGWTCPFSLHVMQDSAYHRGYVMFSSAVASRAVRNLDVASFSCPK